MKKRTRLFTLLLSLCLICMSAMTVMAEETDGTGSKDEYTYQIRIFTGKQGTFASGAVDDENKDSNEEGEPEDGEEVTDGDGEEEVELPGTAVKVYSSLNGGIEITINWQNVKLLDEKYYVKGIRESGKEELATPTFKVDGDKDYVIAYGLRGKMVNYTVRYIDAVTKEELLDSQTFEGKVGDKPVVAYQYKEGYRPQANNLTKTLVEDEAENVFTFEYSVATNPPGRVIGSDGEIVTIIDDGLTVNVGQGDITDLGTTETVIGGGAGAGGDAGAGEGGVTIGDEPTPLEAPQQLIDLDDEDVPLAGNNGIGSLFGTEGNASILGIPIVVFIMIGLVMAGGLWYAFIYKKKKKEQEETKS